MRYTEEKETKNNSKSHAVTARMRWGKVRVPLFDGHGRYSGAFLREKPVDRGPWGLACYYSRLWPRFQIPDHLTTRLRLIIHMAQARILDTPLALASSHAHKDGALLLFIHPAGPLSFPRTPIRFFSKDRHSTAISPSTRSFSSSSCFSWWYSSSETVFLLRPGR